jgi:hypothetical protein
VSSDEHQNLPVPAKVHALEIPVAEFEGEYVRNMLGKIPGITLEMDYGYARGTHLKLELEVRVRKVAVDEVAHGKNKGDLFRLHEFVIEEAKILGAYTAEQADPGVGGGLAATGNDIEDEEQETDDRPEGGTDERAGGDIPDF